MSNVFLDTNILVYTLDNNDPAKRDHCRKLLVTLRDEGSGVISTQVLQEFYVVATQKLGVEAPLAKSILHALQNMTLVTVTPQLIDAAIDCSMLHQLSFWDALIVVSAESARCSELWTEDMNHGQIIQGVRVRNPLI